MPVFITGESGNGKFSIAETILQQVQDELRLDGRMRVKPISIRSKGQAIAGRNLLRNIVGKGIRDIRFCKLEEV